MVRVKGKVLNFNFDEERKTIRLQDSEGKTRWVSFFSKVVPQALKDLTISSTVELEIEIVEKDGKTYENISKTADESFIIYSVELNDAQAQVMENFREYQKKMLRSCLMDAEEIVKEFMKLNGDYEKLDLSGKVLVKKIVMDTALQFFSYRSSPYHYAKDELGK